MIELACANCHKTGGLWRAVTIEADAWQDITASLTEDGKLTKELGPIQDVGSYGSEISSVEYYACSHCEERFRGGLREATVRLDRDGNPIPEPNPNQLSIDAQ